jgi:hypothetical protein
MLLCAYQLVTDKACRVFRVAKSEVCAPMMASTPFVVLRSFGSRSLPGMLMPVLGCPASVRYVTSANSLGVVEALSSGRATSVVCFHARCKYALITYPGQTSNFLVIYQPLAEALFRDGENACQAIYLLSL